MNLDFILNSFMTEPEDEFVDFMTNYNGHEGLLMDMFSYLKSEDNEFIKQNKKTINDIEIMKQHMPKIPRNLKSKSAREAYQEEIFNFFNDWVPVIESRKVANALQNKLKFVLFDPTTRDLINGENIDYGYGDVVRFIGMPRIVSKILRTDINPFYTPINYPVPDFDLNSMLEMYQDKIRLDVKLHDLAKYYTIVKKNYILYKKKLDSSDEETARHTNEYLNYITTLIQYIRSLSVYHQLKLNPIVWSKTIENQTRPMENFIHNDLQELLLIINSDIAVDDVNNLKKKPLLSIQNTIPAKFGELLSGENSIKDPSNLNVNKEPEGKFGLTEDKESSDDDEEDKNVDAMLRSAKRMKNEERPHKRSNVLNLGIKHRNYDD